jgi:hypothetical protein
MRTGFGRARLLPSFDWFYLGMSLPARMVKMARHEPRPPEISFCLRA